MNIFTLLFVAFLCFTIGIGVSDIGVFHAGHVTEASTVWRVFIVFVVIFVLGYLSGNEDK